MQEWSRTAAFPEALARRTTGQKFSGKNSSRALYGKGEWMADQGNPPGLRSFGKKEIVSRTGGKHGRKEYIPADKYCGRAALKRPKDPILGSSSPPDPLVQALFGKPRWRGWGLQPDSAHSLQGGGNPGGNFASTSSSRFKKFSARGEETVLARRM